MLWELKRKRDKLRCVVVDSALSSGLTLLGFMGPALQTNLTILECGWGTGPSHTIKKP